MCAHNGTHIDAPFHFINNGKTAEKIDLFKCIGFSYVAIHKGILNADDATHILNEARGINIEASKRILIKGDAVVSESAAKIFVSHG